MQREERFNGLMLHLQDMGISQILLSDPMAIYYFTGKLFCPGERFLGLYLNQKGRAILFVNRLFPCEEDLGVEKVWLNDTDDAPKMVSLYTDHDQVLGVDKDLAAKFLLPLMEYGAGAGFVNASIAADRQRSCKDAGEQEKMIRCSLINDQAMEEFRRLIVPGVTEQQIADKLPDIYKACGADRIDFGIVAFGANAADPHHEPDDTVLKEGDVVLLDVGCVTDGYCSDMTRCFFFGSAGEKQREVYETVRRANETAEQMIRPGVRFCDIDKAARDVIENAGYGPYFTHRLGHSIGLVDHEFGDVSSVNTDVVKPGMTFSIEPGIYLPGEFGVRIEDLVLVTDDGVQVMNHYGKELTVIDGAK